MNVIAIAQAPFGMPTPQSTETVVLTIMWVLVALFALGMLFAWRKTGKPTGVLLMLGGLFCSLNEALVDVLGHCFFPVGSWHGYTLFDRPIPVWVILAYAIFFGALAYVGAVFLQRGVSRQAMWIGIAVFWVLNTLLELPILGSDLYLYYGDQPLAIGGFPIVWLTINSLGSFAAAAVAVRFSAVFVGPRQLLLLALPFCAYMTSWVLSMPYFLTVNSNAGSGVRIAGALVSMALAALAIDGLIRMALNGRSATASVSPDEQRVPVAA